MPKIPNTKSKTKLRQFGSLRRSFGRLSSTNNVSPRSLQRSPSFTGLPSKQSFNEHKISPIVATLRAHGLKNMERHLPPKQGLIPQNKSNNTSSPNKTNTISQKPSSSSNNSDNFTKSLTPGKIATTGAKIVAGEVTKGVKKVASSVVNVTKKMGSSVATGIKSTYQKRTKKAEKNYKKTLEAMQSGYGNKIKKKYVQNAIVHISKQEDSLKKEITKYDEQKSNATRSLRDAKTSIEKKLSSTDENIRERTKMIEDMKKSLKEGPSDSIRFSSESENMKPDELLKHIKKKKAEFKRNLQQTILIKEQEVRKLEKDKTAYITKIQKYEQRINIKSKPFNDAAQPFKDQLLKYSEDKQIILGKSINPAMSIEDIKNPDLAPKLESHEKLLKQRYDLMRQITKRKSTNTEASVKTRQATLKLLNDIISQKVMTPDEATIKLAELDGIRQSNMALKTKLETPEDVEKVAKLEKFYWDMKAQIEEKRDIHLGNSRTVMEKRMNELQHTRNELSESAKAETNTGKARTMKMGTIRTSRDMRILERKLGEINKLELERLKMQSGTKPLKPGDRQRMVELTSKLMPISTKTIGDMDGELKKMGVNDDIKTEVKSRMVDNFMKKYGKDISKPLSKDDELSFISYQKNMEWKMRGENRSINIRKLDGDERRLYEYIGARLDMMSKRGNNLRQSEV